MRIKKILENIKKYLSFWEKTSRKRWDFSVSNDKIVDIKIDKISTKKALSRRFRKNIASTFLSSFLKNKKIIFILVFIWIISYFSYFLFIWEKFKITAVEIVWEDQFVNKDLAYLWAKELIWENIFSVSTKQAIDLVSIFQKNIDFVKLKRIFPWKITVEPISYTPLLYLEKYKIRYIITENWVLLPYFWEKNDLYQTSIYNFDKDYQKLLYTQVLQSRIIEKINQHLQVFTTNFLLENIAGIDYFLSEKELHINLKEGPKLILDIEQNPEDQLKRYLIFNTKYDSYDYFYVDLRISKKVFSCSLKEKNLCQKNLSRIYNYNF